MWSGPLSEGKVAVTIFNRGDTTAKITAFGNALSLVPNRRYTAHDAWRNAAVPLAGRTYTDLTLPVAPHAVRAVTLN